MAEKKTVYLDAIHSPADLRALPDAAMPALAEEIRAFLIDHVRESGGHLASNLGVVELTLALHRVFDTPRDHLIFDVGHQCYVHKMLTGRADRFERLRQVGGLSGFTSRRESPYDPFGAGHSSTSVSAALGFAEADRMAGRDAYTVAVIGDGAFTGGMVHEALNNCRSDLPLIVVLNENEMSISRNTGAFARYLATIRATHTYLTTKRRTAAFLRRLPLVGQPLYRAVRRFTLRLKHNIYKSNYFEDLGFLYLGPIDGNDYAQVARALYRARARHSAVVVHIKTKKGKGYAPAEEEACAYHSVSPSRTPVPDITFHRVFGEELIRLARQDTRITAITAAMGLGCGLDGFRATFPDRFFDVGIAEEHAVTFAAGLAANGALPCFAVYSTFLQRAYDNVLHDVALQNLPVKLFIDRAGLAPADGATHHGIFDVSFLSAIPNLRLYAPACFGSLRAIMREVFSSPAPCAVRYPNATEDPRVAAVFYPDGDFAAFGVRADFSAENPPPNIVLTYGSIVREALDAKETAGADRVGILLLESLKPYTELVARIRPYLRKKARLIYLEEGILAGGAGEEISRTLREAMGAEYPEEERFLAIRDHFATPDTPVSLYRYCGISALDVLENMK